VKGVRNVGGGEAYRLGGDEFVLLLPEAAWPKAQLRLKGLPLSFGLAPAEEKDPLAWADRRMYRQKREKKAQR
jgi:GGDEF domain-containing protein